LGVAFPIFVIEADQSQAGKGTFVKTIAGIYGEVPGMVATMKGGVGNGVDEAFARQALRGRPILQIDNIRGRLDSQFLEAFVTATGLMHSRALRCDGEVDTRNYLIFATSNGIESTVDITNRSLIIRLKKRDFGYRWHQWPEGSLNKHIEKHRGRYLGCIFKIFKHWIGAGCPEAPCHHDVREVTGAMNWIVVNCFGLPAIDSEHSNIQMRASNPGMTFLRELVIRMKAPYAKLTVTDMIRKCCEENLDVFGLDLDTSDDDNMRKAQKLVGQKLAPCFAEEPQIVIDGTTIDRTIVQEARADGNGSFEKKIYIFKQPSNADTTFTNNNINYTKSQFNIPKARPTVFNIPPLVTR
jgi:hypothetical protein